MSYDRVETMIGKERRVAKRISYVCEVEWEKAGMGRVNTRLNDLSMTGAFIDSMTCFAVGSILKMKFRVRGVMIETSAEVRYSMPQVGMGVRFLDMIPEHVAALESLIEGKPMAEPAAPSGPLPSADQMALATSAQSVLSGNFAVVSLFDVIQMVENSRLTGALAVTLPNSRGEVYFNEGQIVGAEAGSDSRLDALNCFLGATEGIFEFRKSLQQYARTIQSTSNMGLLLDLLRAKDEEAAALDQLFQ